MFYFATDLLDLLKFIQELHEREIKTRDAELSCAHVKQESGMVYQSTMTTS
jgi:hypothetical protein